MFDKLLLQIDEVRPIDDFSGDKTAQNIAIGLSAPVWHRQRNQGKDAREIFVQQFKVQKFNRRRRFGRAGLELI